MFKNCFAQILSNVSMLNAMSWIFISGLRTCIYLFRCHVLRNKANLRDLISASGLVISHWIQLVDFSARVTLKFDGWPRKTIEHFFYTTSSFVHHFKSISEFKLELQYGNAQSCRNWWYFVPCDLEIWWMTLENNRAPLLYYTKLYPSFLIHRWSQTWVSIRKRSIRVKIGDFFVPRDLEI